MYGCPWINYFFFPPYECSHFCPPPQERYCFRVGLLQVCSLAWFLCVCLITCRIKNSTSMLIGSVCPVCLSVCLSVSTLAVRVLNQSSSSYHIIIVWAKGTTPFVFGRKRPKVKGQRSNSKGQKHIFSHISCKYRSDSETVKCVG